MIGRTARKAKRATRETLKAVASPRSTKRKVKLIYSQKKANYKREKSYHQWFKAYEKSIKADIENQRSEAKNFELRPLISVIVPIYNTDKAYLRKCIQSVVDQSYDNWELCIADDASTTDPLSVVKDMAKIHKNIKWTRLAKNQHIAGASNEAIKIASGEFIALLDHDDVLLPNALFEMVRAINENPDHDLFHSDEDKIEGDKNHIEPFFKPDWSPDFMRSCNYITHFAVLRKSVVDKIGGFRLGTEGAQDWDLFLRFLHETKKIKHVPRILYSWRKSETSTAGNSGSKPYAYINQQRVLRDDIIRSGDKASVLPSHYLGFWNVKYHPQNNSKVSIVIPSKDNYKFIKQCLESIIEKTTYPFFDVVVVDTGSTDKDVLEFYESKLVKTNPVKIVNLHKPKFNFSEACNYGAKNSDGEYLLFLNNDTEVITEEWIEGMLGQAQRKNTGMVGCKLLFPSGNIQHAGVVLSDRDIAFHPFYNQDPRVDIFTNIYVSNTKNCAAVTAACSMVSRKKFDKVGGFDTDLRVTYNDVDLCLKLLDAGYQNIYTPYTELYHHESVSVGKMGKDSRDHKEVSDAAELMRKKWGKYLKHDPYYNANFTQHGPGYEL